MIKIVSDYDDTPAHLQDSNWWTKMLLEDLFFLNSVGLRFGKKGKEYRDLNWIHKELCDFIDFRTTPYLQKLILMFRDGLKSSNMRGFVAQWFLRKRVTDHPGKIFLFSGNFDLAQDHLERVVRELLENRLLRAFFGKLLPDSKKDFDVLALDKGKLRYKGLEIDLGSPEKSLTGHHYEGGINDNLVNEVNSQSEDSREKTHRRWRQQESILAEESWELVFETPWWPDDVSGRMLCPDETQQFDYSTLYRKPALKFMSDSGYYVFSCPCRNEDGEPVFPEKTDEKYLARKKKKQGEYLYNALYELQPVIEQDVVLKARWIQHYDTLPANHIRNLTIDCSGTKKKESTYTAMVLGDWDEVGTLHIPYAEKRKLDPCEVRDWALELIDMCDKEGRPITYIGIESEKYGIFLADVFKELDLEPIITLIDIHNIPKDTRLSELVAKYQDVRILSKKGLTDYEHEVKTYYRGKKKGVDILDAVQMQWRIQLLPQKLKTMWGAENLLITSKPSPPVPQDFLDQLERDRQSRIGHLQRAASTF